MAKIAYCIEDRFRKHDILEKKMTGLLLKEADKFTDGKAWTSAQELKARCEEICRERFGDQFPLEDGYIFEYFFGGLWQHFRQYLDWKELGHGTYQVRRNNNEYPPRYDYYSVPASFKKKSPSSSGWL